MVCFVIYNLVKLITWFLDERINCCIDSLLIVSLTSILSRNFGIVGVQKWIEKSEVR
jgi:hypothetical protein